MSLLFLYIIQFFVCVGLWLHVCQSAFFGQEAELPELPHQSFRLSPLKRAAERFVIQTVIGCFICKISQVAVGIACKMNPLTLSPGFPAPRPASASPGMSEDAPLPSLDSPAFSALKLW